MRAPLTPLLLLVMTSLAATSGGCATGRGSAREAPGSDAPVATVNGEAIAAGRFERFMSVKLGELADEPLGDGVRSQLFDEFLKREVTAQAATRRGLGAGPPGGATPIGDELATDRLVETYYRECVLRDLDVSADEVDGYLRANRAALGPDDGYYVRELRVGSREEAERLRAQIASSTIDFAAAAREASDTAAAGRGGLAFYAAGQLPEPLERAVSSLEVGQLSEVIPTSYGFHVFRMEGRGVRRPAERAREAAEAELRTRKGELLVEADAERLLAEADIGVEPGRLKFRYEGRFRRVVSSQ